MSSSPRQLAAARSSQVPSSLKRVSSSWIETVDNSVSGSLTIRRPLRASGASTMTSQPGAEFLLARLARAEAAPPAERSPEVAAFVDSVFLLRNIPRLLPLNADCSAALPPSPATRRRTLLALLRLAHAKYLCLPGSPVADVDHHRPLAVYCRMLVDSGVVSASGGGGSTGALVLLEQVLLHEHGLGNRPVLQQPLQQLFDAITVDWIGAELAAPLQELQSQAQAEGQRQSAFPLPLNAAQLQYRVLCSVLMEANMAHTPDNMVEQQQALAYLAGYRVPPSRLPELQALSNSCRQQLLSLEPDNPGGLYTAAAGLLSDREWAASTFRHMCELARQQRNAWLASLSANMALKNASLEAAEVCMRLGRSANTALVQTAQGAAQQGQQDAKGCRRMLPQAWLELLDSTARGTASAYRTFQAAQALVQGRMSRSAATASMRAAMEVGLNAEACASSAAAAASMPLA